MSAKTCSEVGMHLMNRIKMKPNDERRITFFKFCLKCDKKFHPTTKYSKVCEKCRKLKKRFKNANNL